MGRTSFILFCIVHTAVCIFAFMWGRDIQYFIIGSANILLGTALMRHAPFRPLVAMAFVFAPVILLYLVTSVVIAFSNNYNGLPYLFIASLSAVLSVFIYKWELGKLIRAVALFLAFNLLTAVYLNNYFHILHDLQSDYNLEGRSLDELNLIIRDEHGNIIKADAFRGKISVIDVWASNCGVCISGFPNFEQTKTLYKQDGAIAFYALNIAVKNENPERVKEFTRNYSFQKLYTDEQGFDKLGIDGVPICLIVDKDLSIEYAGILLDDRTNIYNNFHSIIRSIKDR